MTMIAFIGLGVMGKPMAKNLLAAGHDLVVHSRSPGPVGELVAAGAAAASSPAEAVAGAGCVITMLPDSPDVESVMLGENGVLDNVAAETLLIDMSTIRPETSRKVAERAEAVSAYCLDAPVSGGEKGAIDGTLSVMVGGHEATFILDTPQGCRWRRAAASGCGSRQDQPAAARPVWKSSTTRGRRGW